MCKKSALMLFSAVGTLAFGLTLALQPAMGLKGSWTPYGNTNPITSSKSTWKCGTSKTIDYLVSSQVCVVRTPDGTKIQGAIIVRNSNNYLYNANADVIVKESSSGYIVGDWYCSSSGVGANSWSVCFGETYPEPHSVYSDGHTTGAILPRSGYL